MAILAKRGQCSYETKARVASQRTSPHGVVRFVIVYDDDISDGDHLITMMPSSTGINPEQGDSMSARRHNLGDHGYHNIYPDVGLVFVSYASGVGECGDGRGLQWCV